MVKIKILALEGYYGGSHKAFLDGWIKNSRCDWTLLTLPPNKWKWRMRHSAITLAERVNSLVSDGKMWDVLFCSDMLNLAEFRGLVHKAVLDLPTVVYFHENQLTYPVRTESERDYQYVMTNFTTALAAEAVWFNSAFHRDEFFNALTSFFRRMPDYHPTALIDGIRQVSRIQPPGIEAFPLRSAERKPGPLRILWVARWEHDKNPEDFFAAMKILKEKKIEFRLSVIGEQFRCGPEVFEWAKGFFAGEIDRWGYQPGRKEYEKTLEESDIVVSTANHEFFGISVVEAIAAGAYPVLPKRLAYPEVIREIKSVRVDEFFYDGSVTNLAQKIETLATKVQTQDLWAARPGSGQLAMRKYFWPRRAEIMDNSFANGGLG